MVSVLKGGSSIAGLLVALMLADPVTAASTGNQAIADQRAAEKAASGYVPTAEEEQRDRRIGSGVAAGVVIVVIAGIALFAILASDAAFFPESSP